jgi:hypothetical protein
MPRKTNLDLRIADLSVMSGFKRDLRLGRGRLRPLPTSIDSVYDPGRVRILGL